MISKQRKVKVKLHFLWVASLKKGEVLILKAGVHSREKRGKLSNVFESSLVDRKNKAIPLVKIDVMIEKDVKIPPTFLCSRETLIMT